MVNLGTLKMVCNQFPGMEPQYIQVVPKKVMVVVGACLTMILTRNQYRLKAWGPVGAPEGV